MNSSDSLATVPTTGLGIDAISAQYLTKNADIFEILVASSSDYHQLIVNNFTVFERFCLRRLHNREQVAAASHAMMFSYIVSGKLLEMELPSEESTEATTEYAKFLAICRRFQNIDRTLCAAPVVGKSYDLLDDESVYLIDPRAEINKLEYIWQDLMATEPGRVVRKMFLDLKDNKTMFGAILAVELFSMMLEPLMLGVFQHEPDDEENCYESDAMISILDAFQIFVRNIVVVGVPSAIWKPVLERFAKLEICRRKTDDNEEFIDNASRYTCVMNKSMADYTSSKPQMRDIDAKTAVEFVHHFIANFYPKNCTILFLKRCLVNFFASLPEEISKQVFDQFAADTFPFSMEQVRQIRANTCM